MESHRLLHEIYCWFSLCLFFPCYYYGGPLLFLAQTILGGGLACLIDWYISPTFSANVKRIVGRGLSPSAPFLPTSQLVVLLNVYATIFTSEAIAVTLVVATGGYDATPHFDFRLLFNMLINVVVSELVFTTAHSYILHGTKWGAYCHQIHHTCRPSSFSTSFTFHFMDSMTEFTLTHCCMTLFNWYLLKDSFSLLCTIQITYLWYTVAGHSENIQLPHYFHHQFINARYSAYIKHPATWFKGQRDCVKDLVEDGKRREIEENEIGKM